MATKSIFKDIIIRDKKLGQSLVYALENAHKYRRKEHAQTQKCIEVKNEDIKKFFEDR